MCDKALNGCHALDTEHIYSRKAMKCLTITFFTTSPDSPSSGISNFNKKKPFSTMKYCDVTVVCYSREKQI
jgi:hypothetical protein